MYGLKKTENKHVQKFDFCTKKSTWPNINLGLGLLNL
jgi:hypothetical protein